MNDDVCGTDPGKAEDQQRGSLADSEGNQWNHQPITEQQKAAFDIPVFDKDQLVTDIAMPEWFEMLLAVTRIAELQIRVEEEKAERAKDTFQNPYQMLYDVVNSIKFEIFVAGTILLNCLEIGLEASLPNDEGADVFNVCEHIFVGFFLFEWCLRMRACGWVWFFEIPNAADTFLVFVTGVLPKWILEPLGFDLGVLRIVTVLRALRLVRIVRVVRFLPQWRVFWMLIQGLMQSARPLMWTTVIGFMILYIFGIAATELIGRQSTFEDDEYVQELFGNPVHSMFTLFQIMTLDSWGYSIARPVMTKEWNMCMFFVIFIMVGVFVFWNLITAVIVENASSIAEADAQQIAKTAEAKKKQELKVLADLISEIDTDCSGELSTDEFIAALANPKVRSMLDLIGVKVEEMEEVWTVLDDGDGILSIKDFSRGLMRMKGKAKAKDIADVIKKLRFTAVRHAELQSKVNSFNEVVSCLENDVEHIQEDTGEVLGLFKEMFHRLQAQINKDIGEDRMYVVKQAKKHEESESDVDDDEEPESPHHGLTANGVAGPKG